MTIRAPLALTLAAGAASALFLFACGDSTSEDATGATQSSTGATTAATTTTSAGSSKAASNSASASQSGSSGTGSLADVAAEIDGYRFELPCTNPDPTAYAAGDNCPWDPALLDGPNAVDDPEFELKIVEEKTIAGDPATTYDVKLHVRGVSEPKNYMGGEAIGDNFYVGGTEVRDDYNIYSLHVSDPDQIYYFTRDEQPTGHRINALDYEATIPMKGGATLTMTIADHNTLAISNGFGTVVDGVPPAPDAYSGHFIQLDVVEVTVQE